MGVAGMRRRDPRPAKKGPREKAHEKRPATRKRSSWLPLDHNFKTTPPAFSSRRDFARLVAGGAAEAYGIERHFAFIECDIVRMPRSEGMPA